MIVNFTSNPIQESENFKKRGMGIKASPQAFRVLSDNLYSDKPLAIVRELVCNAWDAHQISKTDKPIEVTLPTYLEKNFIVKDYGPGMSHSFMLSEDIDKDGECVGYATVFHSSKTGGNDQIGGFGLGRLSALSYTDSYFVTSITDKKRFYNVCFQDGCPTVIFMGEQDTDEPTGVEVKVPVKETINFEIAAKKFFKNNSINVVLKGISFVPEVSTPKLSFKNWRLYNSSHYSAGKVFVKMGLVHYPIDSTKLNLTQPYLRNGYDLYIDIPIGSIEITPSRESVSYSDATIKFINEIVNKALFEISQYYQNLIECCKTLWEARLKIGEIGTNRGVVSKLTWRNREIRASITDLNDVNQVGYSGSLYYAREIAAREDTKIFIDDPTPNKSAKLKEISKNGGTVYVISLDQYRLYADEFDGYGKIDFVSSITLPQRATTPKVKRKPAERVMKYNFERDSLESLANPPTSGFFFKGSKNSWTERGKVRELIREMKTLNEPVPDIYWLSTLSKQDYGLLEFKPWAEQQIKNNLNSLNPVVEDLDPYDLTFVNYISNLCPKKIKFPDATKSTDSALLALCNHYSIPVKKCDKRKKYLKDLFDKYPMLSIVKSSGEFAYGAKNLDKIVKNYIEEK